LAVKAQRLLGDESPLVRGAAVWALSQLLEGKEFKSLAASSISSETDETVRAEWRAAESVESAAT
jgi:epoxyqueuosine reductase